MTRINLFEFGDKHWCPRIIRDTMTVYLGYLFGKKMNVYKSAIPIIKKVLQVTRKRRILELCAGAGFHGSRLQRELDGMDMKVGVTLTDKYPNVAAFEREKEINPKVTFIREPVDATRVPRSIEGVRVMYGSFHHFNPEQARKILQDTVDKEDAICVFEGMGPYPGAFVAMLFVPLMVIDIVRQMMHPIGCKRFILTYIIPVLPLIVLWDAIASMLRIYMPHELTALVKRIRGKSFKWEIGIGRGKMTYLVGYPRITPK